MTLAYGLKDFAFSHDLGSVAGQPSSNIVWVRDEEMWSKCNGIFVTDQALIRNSHQIKERFPKTPIFGWTIESRGVNPSPFEFLAENFSIFDVIFTHDSNLLRQAPNARFSPGGGVWIGGSHAGGYPGIHPKTKNVSMVSSNKVMTQLHRFRLATALKLKYLNSGVDVFLGNTPAAWRSLRDFRFSVVLENFQSDYYFTEKLLNCFATGVVPIYLGARKIDEFFDATGILRFETKSELKSHLSRASGELYESMNGAVQRNFSLSKDYRNIEDFIFNNYLKDSKGDQ